MKRLLIAVGAVVCFGLGSAVAIAASGTPEINRANATLQLSGNLTKVACTGEDAIPYATWTGSYSGGESQVMPDPTDYPLTGKVSISGVAWTVNLKTLRGVFTSTIVLANSAGAIEYRGSLTLITQGAPGASAPAIARGWINAKFVGNDDGVPPTSTNPNDDSLIANTEFKLSPTSAVGQFGDLAGGGTLSFKDLSVVTNVAPAALDGRC